MQGGRLNINVCIVWILLIQTLVQIVYQLNHGILYCKPKPDTDVGI